jgi:WD40 repeat protein
VTDNHGTQRDGPPITELPKIVVYDYTSRSQKHVLAGHESYVVWTAFSPDDCLIASTSHDGTCRIFDAVTGDCRHIINLIDGQCSSGAWSPDSKHITTSGRGRRVSAESGTVESYLMMTVISVKTGKEVASFKHGNPNPRHCLIAWSSRGDIALTQDTDIWIWQPFEDQISSCFSLDVEDRILRRYASFAQISWTRDGKLLIVMCGDGTVEIWDRDADVKWTLQRPQGLTTERFGQAFTWLEQHRTLMCMNGDGSLRFYRLE